MFRCCEEAEAFKNNFPHIPHPLYATRMFRTTWILYGALMLTYSLVSPISLTNTALRTHFSEQPVDPSFITQRTLNEQRFDSKDWVVECIDKILDNKRWKDELSSMSSRQNILNLVISHHSNTLSKFSKVTHSEPTSHTKLTEDGTIAREANIRTASPLTFLLYLNRNVDYSSKSTFSPHNIIHSHLSSAHDHLYEVLSEDYAVIGLTWNDMSTLADHLPDVINDFIVLHPELKFTSSLSELGRLSDEGICSKVSKIDKKDSQSTSILESMDLIKHRYRQSMLKHPFWKEHSVDVEEDPVENRTSTVWSSVHTQFSSLRGSKNKLKLTKPPSMIKLSFAFQTPSTQLEFDNMVSEIQQLSSVSARKLSLEIDEFHGILFKPNQRMYGSIQFTKPSSTSCSEVYDVALTLATNFPSIATISLQQPFYPSNKYAKELCSSGDYTSSSSFTGDAEENEPLSAPIDEPFPISGSKGEDPTLQTLVQSIRSPSHSSYDVLHTTTTTTATTTVSTEVIGITDTGLDLYSCYFYDPTFFSSTGTSLSYSFQTKLAKTVLNTNHRKVIQYVSYVDTSDDSDAHGTHVSGSACGSLPPPTSMPSMMPAPTMFPTTASDYEGMYPDGKIAFFDIGRDDTSDLYTPDNINTNIFSILYPSGARIFSNSWGSDDSMYTDIAQQSDTFMYKYPDTLLVYANGNAGKFTLNCAIWPN